MRGRGLMIASHLTEQLSIASKRAGGSRVSAMLPVERAESEDPSTAIGYRGLLPEEHEADDGFFPREPFLRALTVELAHLVDIEHGPVASERLITGVGGSVGGHMEDAYRADRSLEGRLRPEQIADLYVGLKSAIGGDFYVVSIDDERIVLGNRKCPFGDAVKHAPSLCRMTSSVFGAIAARNSDSEVAVHLEERIAVGDPECRVVVWLGNPPPELEPFVHRYRAELAND
ncbi:MAG: hypothetical protein HKN24_06520 [Acidimicrobiales bacterium]|nr:hypothetical protein [Acidimicrobiales bacterium]